MNFSFYEFQNNYTMKRYLKDSEIDYILSFLKPNKSIPIESALSIINNLKTRLIKQLKTIEIYPELIDELKIQIENNYQSSLISPGESVGILAAQSIGEKNTQNSVFFEERILVKKNKKFMTQSIGEFIENEMKKGYVIEFEKDNYIKEVSNIEILTISQEEKIEWKNITELSKHPTNGNLVKIKTESGREVTTTLSHSHLKKFHNSIIPVLGSKLKIGDRIPVIKKSPTFNSLNFIHISDIIDYDILDNKYIYVNETKIENKIYLDKNFGQFLGIYLSQGYCTKYCTYIQNITNETENNLKIFCLKYNLEHIISKNSEDITYIIKSIILTRLLKKLCNTEYKDKNISNIIFNTNNIFISNVLRGYIDGHKNISINKNKELVLRFSSKNLVEEFNMLFTCFEIFTSINQYKLIIKGKNNIKKYKDKIGTDLSYLKVEINNLLLSTKYDISKDSEIIPHYIGSHITKISSILKLEGYSNYGSSKKGIERNILGEIIKIFKEEANLKNLNIDEHLKYCELSYNSDVIWDKIIDIQILEEKNYKYKYVYDFSVKGNETFALFSGIVVHNTLNTLNSRVSNTKSIASLI